MKNLIYLMKNSTGKNYFLYSLLIFLAIFFLLPSTGHTQVVTESAKKKITVGIGEFTDIWMKMPTGTKSRTINQGFNIYSTYNIPFGKSNFSFAIGLGLTIHNMYGNFLVNSYTDSTNVVKIPDTISYKKSKMCLTYLEVPLEFRFKTKSKFTVALGFKGGLEIASSTKYVGNGPVATYNFTVNQAEKTKIKMSGIKNLEKFTYGPTIRFGYSWINVNAGYMLSTIFQKGRGPEIYPISVGIVLSPF
ncbi:MAG: outer membrane beta-barrel protein [Bacteroidetes bacterium]|nr:outer membrane beta-barrel protein [Bacteroidota bacterium]